MNKKMVHLHIKSFKDMRFRLFIIILSFLSVGLFAQENATIILKQADKFIGENINGITYNFLTGNVILIHDSTTFYCDSAKIDKLNNNFEAYGNIYAIMSDSLELYGDKLIYNGNTKITRVYDNVRLIDDSTTLYTDYLVYYRLLRKGVFDRGGRIVDGDNVLTSKIGEYYSALNEYHFRNNVVVNTPDYEIKSDTLIYNTVTEVVDFQGYSTLDGEEDFMFAYKGTSDTKNDITILKEHGTVQHKNQILYGDSIYYDKKIEYGYAFKNAILMDIEKEVVIEGQIVEYLKQKGYGYATDSAMAVLIDNQDSLFLHADTLKMILDSADYAEKLIAFNHVKFFREDLQGASDSLVYHVNDSIISMYQEPVLWSDENQLTSDSMKIYMTNQQMDSLVMYNSALIISQDSTNTFNQIRGRDVIGHFRDNELYQINVNGNSETIYYVRDDITHELIGLNKAVASNMKITVKDRKIVSIVYMTNPSATLYPIFEITEENKKLKGFKWLEHLRPWSKQEIFIKDSSKKSSGEHTFLDAL